MFNLALVAGYENFTLNYYIFELFYFLRSLNLQNRAGFSVLMTRKSQLIVLPVQVSLHLLNNCSVPGTVPSHQHEESPEKKLVVHADYVKKGSPGIIWPPNKRTIFLSRAIFLTPILACHHLSEGF